MKNSINTTDCMEMPCMCDCGNWFDLHDGYRAKHSNKVICEECHEHEEEVETLEDQIRDLEEAIENKEVKRQPASRQLVELKKKLELLINK